MRDWCFIGRNWAATEKVSKPIPAEEYKRLVKAGFLEFAEFLKNHDFAFSEESSFGAFMECYGKLAAGLERE